jgi:hypothetical protein
MNDARDSSRVIGELSARGLSNIRSGESDFVFAFDEDEIRCTRFQAQFLSPTVCSLLQEDPSIDRIRVEIESEHQSVATSFLVRLIESGQIDVSVSDISVLGEFCRFLGNGELLDLFVKTSLSTVNEGNVVQRLKLFGRDDDLSFLASHFSSVCEQVGIETLSFDLLSTVLSHCELRLESEDSLFRFIERLCSRDDGYRDLIAHVETQYLSESCIEDYVSFIDPFRMNGGTWQSICRRLCLPVSPSSGNCRVKTELFESVKFDGEASSMFRGIFHRMSEDCKGNPHLRERVRVSANDEFPGNGLAVYNLICASDKRGLYWCTKTTTRDHYIKFGFPSCRICPSGYSLKAHNKSFGASSYLRSWRFEGSNDDSEWTTLHAQDATDAIAANDKEAYFAISTTRVCRFLRIMVGSPNSSGYHQFSLQQIEIFGQIHPSASV